MANLTGRKLGKAKNHRFGGGGKYWNKLLSKYMIYAPNVRQSHALKLVLEANGKHDWYKIVKNGKKA